jgi:hypothetical protein
LLSSRCRCLCGYHIGRFLFYFDTRLFLFDILPNPVC